MCLGSKNILWVSFYQNIEIQQNIFADVSIFEKIQNFDNFSGFCSPEFDLFMKDLAIFDENVMNNIQAFQKLNKNTSNVLITK